MLNDADKASRIRKNWLILFPKPDALFRDDKRLYILLYAREIDLKGVPVQMLSFWPFSNSRLRLRLHLEKSETFNDNNSQSYGTWDIKADFVK